MIAIEEGETYAPVHCDCCGMLTRSISGFAFDGDDAAAYYVCWTDDQLERHGADFDLIIGRWGDAATADDRAAVSVLYRIVEDEPGFMVVDSGDRWIARSPLVGQALARDQVIGSPWARWVFDVIDAICLQDTRVGQLRGQDH